MAAKDGNIFPEVEKMVKTTPGHDETLVLFELGFTKIEPIKFYQYF